MKLLTFNANNVVNQKLEGVIVKDRNYPEGDAFYFDYLPIWKDKEKFLLQIDILKHYIKKKIPIIVFDKYLSIKPDEHEWLLKFRNVSLFEPAINYRQGFRYLPHFCQKVKGISDLLLNKDEARGIVVGYKGIISDRIKSFEKYYVELGKNYPQFLIKYDNKVDIAKEKVDEYTNLNVLYDQSFQYKDVKCCMLLGSNRDYQVGFLDPHMFTMLDNNVIIMLPEEHRFYHSLFSDTVVKELHDMVLTVDMYDYTYLGYVLGIYERIEKYYPEMKINHFVDTIKKELI
jgi:hypothetical protein